MQVVSERTFTTFDLGCSAAMISMGFELADVDKENPRKAQFIFRWKDGISQTAERYWADKCKVNARTLFDNIKMIKSRLYS